MGKARLHSTSRSSQCWWKKDVWTRYMCVLSEMHSLSRWKRINAATHEVDTAPGSEGECTMKMVKSLSAAGHQIANQPPMRPCDSEKIVTMRPLGSRISAQVIESQIYEANKKCDLVVVVSLRPFWGRNPREDKVAQPLQVAESLIYEANKKCGSVVVVTMRPMNLMLCVYTLREPSNDVLEE